MKEKEECEFILRVLQGFEASHRIFSNNKNNKFPSLIFLISKRKQTRLKTLSASKTTRGFEIIPKYPWFYFDLNLTGPKEPQKDTN